MIQNVPASVRRRLLNYAREHQRPYNEILQHYALQRFLYRLGASPFRDRFILKGALMLSVLRAPITRPTRDIDLLGRLDNSQDVIVGVLQKVCDQTGGDDGLSFSSDSIISERIIEGGNYHGVRVRFTAHLAKARIPIQIDIGFGDIIVPEPTLIQLPSVLDMPPAQLWGYSPESIIAEKTQTLIALGEINSRMKDFYDIWLLSTCFPFDGRVLCQALGATLDNRHTALAFPIAALDESFANPERERLWRAFLQRHDLETPASLRQLIQAISRFISPPLHAISETADFHYRWTPDGHWH